MHLLPAVFTLGVALLLLGTPFCLFSFTPIILYALLVCIDSTIQNKSLSIGVYSIAAAFIQLIGYGTGFWRAWWQRCIREMCIRDSVKDAHNIISMMIDGEGYMHVSFDHHGHPLNYCRSIAPGSLELGDKMPMTGVDEGNVTYPEFYPLSGGDLLFVYRSGSSGRGNLVMNRYSLKEHKWTRVQDILIDGENKRNAYWQLYVDEKGTIHLSWVWRETWHVETNHDICYARSFDNGVTWYKTSGERYEPVSYTHLPTD